MHLNLSGTVPDSELHTKSLFFLFFFPVSLFALREYVEAYINKQVNDILMSPLKAFQIKIRNVNEEDLQQIFDKFDRIQVMCRHSNIIQMRKMNVKELFNHKSITFCQLTLPMVTSVSHRQVCFQISKSSVRTILITTSENNTTSFI